MKVNIYDVAKAANVSIATVSKVINNTGRISDKTKKKVNDIIRELDYKPSLIASALMGKNTRTIGFILPDLANPFFSELARYIEDKANEYDYNVVICSTDYLKEKEDMYISLLMQKNVDGFILASGFEHFETVQKLMDEEVPVVIVARNYPEVPVNLVAIHDYEAGYQATSYLIQQGHKRISIIARDIWSNRERFRGYSDAMKDHQLPIPSEIYYAKESTIQAGHDSLQQIMQESKIAPTAIFACNDMMAVGAIKASQKMGLVVPDDISVIGFDDTLIAQIINPALTTIAQPKKKIANEAVDLLMSAIDGDTKNHTIILKTELIERESVKKI